MSCQTIEPELLGYQLGAVPAELRLLVEEHLAGCPACLQRYFALKRGLEAEPEQALRPSAAARARLRGAVATEIRRRNAPAPWRWWERPLAFASAAAVACVALVGTFVIATAEPSAPVSIASRAAPSPPQRLLHALPTKFLVARVMAHGRIKRSDFAARGAPSRARSTPGNEAPR